MRPTNTLALILILLPAAASADWPQFRGPSGQGHATVKSAPLEWSEDGDNVRWKVPIDGLGWSSPVVQNDRIWLTTALDEGRSLRAVCLDLDSGRQLHDVEVFQQDDARKIHSKNSHASPTPLIEKDRIYLHFGGHGTACLATTGQVIWRTKMKYSHVHGPGGSPVVDAHRMMFSCDGGDVQFVVALDKTTGEELWRTERPPNDYQKKFAFSTPLLIVVDGQTQLISAGAGAVVAYEPKTGTEIWRVRYQDGYSVVPRPVFGSGLLYVCTGFDRPKVLAIRPNGRGDVTDTHVAWTLVKGAPHSPSPLLVGDELYVVSDRGVATCVDADTGTVHWQERLGGNFSASPLLAAGRIYFVDERGATTVVEPGKTFRQLARNQVDGRTFASLVPLEGILLMRSDTHLYRIDTQ